MNTSKTIFATILVLGVLGLAGWGSLWGVGYLQGVLAEIQPSTMSLVVAGWIGVWGAALIVAVGLRWGHGCQAQAQRQKARADVYGYVLDAWSDAVVVGTVSSDASDSRRDVQVEAQATLRRAERHLTLSGSSGVIDAYSDLRSAEKDDDASEEALATLLTQMRRDLGRTTLTVDVEDLLERPVGDAFMGDRIPVEKAPMQSG